MIIGDNLWRLLSTFIISVSNRLAGGQPADGEVIRKLHRILKNDPFFREDRFQSLNLKWLNSFLDFLAEIPHYPWLIVLSIAVLTGLYFLIRSLSPYIQPRPLSGQSPRQPEDAQRPPSPNYYLTLYRLALEQSEAGLYRQALISLHKATVGYLLAKIIIASPYKKYTNNDLKRMLSADKNLYQPFCIIAGYAEIAGFSAIEIYQTDFARALEVFKQAFL